MEAAVVWMECELADGEGLEGRREEFSREVLGWRSESRSFLEGYVARAEGGDGGVLSWKGGREMVICDPILGIRRRLLRWRIVKKS